MMSFARERVCLFWEGGVDSVQTRNPLLLARSASLSVSCLLAGPTFCISLPWCSAEGRILRRSGSCSRTSLPSTPALLPRSFLHPPGPSAALPPLSFSGPLLHSTAVTVRRQRLEREWGAGCWWAMPSDAGSLHISQLRNTSVHSSLPVATTLRINYQPDVSALAEGGLGWTVRDAVTTTLAIGTLCCRWVQLDCEPARSAHWTQARRMIYGARS